MRWASAVILALAAAVVGAISQQAGADESESFPFCQDRPEEPAIISDMGPKDAHRAYLLQRMYRAHSFDLIASRNDCSCSNRFPDWEAVLAEYRERFARLEDRHDVYEATENFEAEIRTNRTLARELCVAQGHWN